MVNLSTGTVTGGDGNDTITNIENVTGSSYGDTIIGDGSANTIYVGDGNDTIISGAGNDMMTGGNGSDVFVIDDNANLVDTITDFELSYDLIDLSDFNSEVSDFGDLTISQNGSNTEIYLGDFQTLILLNVTASNLSEDHFIGNAGIPGGYIGGTSGDDALNGTSGDDVINGLAGNDTIYGNAGVDTIYGGAGNDTIIGGSGSDTFVFEYASAFNDVDSVTDFDISTDTDILDLSDILDNTSYSHGVDAITDWIEITTSGSHSIVKVDTTGSGSFGAGTQIATLEGITGMTDEAALVSSGNLVVV